MMMMMMNVCVVCAANSETREPNDRLESRQET